MATPLGSESPPDPQAPTADGIASDQVSRAIGTTQPGGRWRRIWKLIRENRKASVGLGLFLVFIIVAVTGPVVAPYDPNYYNPLDLLDSGAAGQNPSSHHLLGTTHIGKDVFSQLLVGTRGSVLVGLVVGLLTTALALSVGLVGGYLGGWIDEILSLITNVFLTLPFVPLMIVVGKYAAAFNVQGLTIIIAMLTLTGWAYGARGKRAQVLALRSKDFVMAARVAGENWFRIVFVEILPNMAALVAATFLFSTVYAVLGEAGLEFIGLGDTNSVTWGTILYYAQQDGALLAGAWWRFIPPGICIGLFALSLTLMNYALDELTNPRLRVRRARIGGRALPRASEQDEIQDTETAPNATLA